MSDYHSWKFGRQVYISNLCDAFKEYEEETPMTIDINNIPVEPTVTILNPDGSELITTNNVTTFTFIRYEIKKNNLIGYKVHDEDGNIFAIRPDGRIFDELLYWPDHLTGEVYDELLGKLL
jgi:hypothetical protein